MARTVSGSVFCVCCQPVITAGIHPSPWRFVPCLILTQHSYFLFLFLFIFHHHRFTYNRDYAQWSTLPMSTPAAAPAMPATPGTPAAPATPATAQTKFVSGLSALVLLQAASRVLTFGLNQALVRLASPAVFGTAAIQFELLLSSILFLCREGVRLALLRTPSPPASRPTPTADAEPNPTPAKGISKKPAKPAKPVRGDPAPVSVSVSVSLTVADDARLASNISTLPFLAGIPIALAFALLYYTNANDETSSQPNFLPAIAIYVVAAIIELAAEPLYIHAQNQLQFGLRVTSEGTGVIFRTLTTVALLLGAPARWNLLAFALGQLAYACSIFIVYWSAYSTHTGAFRLWPVTVTRTVKDQCVLLSLSTCSPPRRIPTQAILVRLADGSTGDY